jgi:hypothetical protein
MGGERFWLLKLDDVQAGDHAKVGMFRVAIA